MERPQTGVPISLTKRRAPPVSISELASLTIISQSPAPQSLAKQGGPCLDREPPTTLPRSAPEWRSCGASAQRCGQTTLAGRIDHGPTRSVHRPRRSPGLHPNCVGCCCGAGAHRSCQRWGVGRICRTRQLRDFALQPAGSRIRRENTKSQTDLVCERRRSATPSSAHIQVKSYDPIGSPMPRWHPA